VGRWKLGRLRKLNPIEKLAEHRRYGQRARHHAFEHLSNVPASELQARYRAAAARVSLLSGHIRHPELKAVEVAALQSLPPRQRELALEDARSEMNATRAELRRRMEFRV